MAGCGLHVRERKRPLRPGAHVSALQRSPERRASRMSTAAVASVTIALTGCGSVVGTGGAAPGSTTTMRPPVQTSMPAPSASASPMPAGNVLTAASNGATVTVATGELLTVDLAPGPGIYAWDRPQLAGSSLRLLWMAGGYPSRGPMRAGFLAVSPGVTVVSTVSDMPCLHTRPRCLVAQREWWARVIVRSRT
jgi:hypothetical protein